MSKLLPISLPSPLTTPNPPNTQLGLALAQDYLQAQSLLPSQKTTTSIQRLSTLLDFFNSRGPFSSILSNNTSRISAAQKKSLYRRSVIKISSLIARAILSFFFYLFQKAYFSSDLILAYCISISLFNILIFIFNILNSVIFN